MAMPWWAKVAGGQQAVQQMANFDATPALANAWYVANQTRLNDNPELGAAVQGAGVDYATARRLDMVFGAYKAQNQRNTIQDAGSSSQMVPASISAPAAAADGAVQQKQQADNQSVWDKIGGWFSRTFGLGSVGPENTAIARMVTPQAESDAASVGLAPKVGSFIAPVSWANAVNNGASKFLDFANKVFNIAASPVAGPEAAGSANQADWERNANQFHFSGILGQLAPDQAVNTAIGTAAVDYARGVKQELTGVDPQQAADMRNQGYDPGNFLSRYNYYANYDNAHPIISNTVVENAKEQFNPLKVDAVREILTSGALTNYDRTSGLSPNAQTALANIQANKDPEASAIMQQLADPTATSLGGHLADGLGLQEGTTARTLVSALGDMAGYWFLSPDMVAGKAFNAYKMARFGVQLDSDAVKAAIMERTPIASKWDDILDRVDNIHVLSTSPDVEHQAQAAQALNDFQRQYPDLQTVYPILAGMRSGAVQGALFKAPDEVAKTADMTPVIGVRYEGDPAKQVPMWQLRGTPGEEVSQDTRDAARAVIAQNVGDALVANAMQEGRPIVGNQMLMPGQLRVTTPIRNAIAGVQDKVFGTGSGETGFLFQQLKDAENKGVLDFSAAPAQTAVANVIDSAAGGQWVRENYTQGGLRARAAMAVSRFQMLRDGADVSFTDPSGMQAYQGLVKFIMPRGQAALMAQRWAVSDPATRSAMWNQLQDTLANARNARDTMAGTDYWKQALKGREQITPDGVRPLEAYSSPDTDMIRTPAGNMTAAMYATQFASGARVPSLTDIIRNTESVGVLSWLTRVSHTRLSEAYARVGKVGQVGTTPTMLKLWLEDRTLQALTEPAGAARVTAARIGLSADTAADRVATNTALRQARTILKSGDMDKLTPLAAQGRNEDYISQVESTLSRRGEQLSPVLRNLLENMNLREGPNAGIQAVAAGRSAGRLAATKLVDPLRTMRANVIKRIGIGTKYTEPFSYDWLDRIDEGFHENLTDGVERLLGNQRGNYPTGGAVEDLAQVHAALDAGNRYARVGLRNTQGYLGAAGDVGAQRWGNALGLRLADPVGEKVLQAVAHHQLQLNEHRDEVAQAIADAQKASPGLLTDEERAHVADRTIAGHFPDGTFSPLAERWARQETETHPDYLGHVADQQAHQRQAEQIQDRMAQLRKDRKNPGADVASIDQQLADHRKLLTQHVTAANTAEDAAEAFRQSMLDHGVDAVRSFRNPAQAAEWLLQDRPEGEAYRLNGRRGMFINGKTVADQADKDAAMSGWAHQMTEDGRRYLSLRTQEMDDGRPLYDDKQALLRTVAAGNKPSFDDLAAVPDRLRPEQVQAPVIVGKQAVDPKLKAVDWMGAKASQVYDLFVGSPTRRLWHDPLTSAARWEAMAAMEPMARALANRGLSTESTYRILDTLAAKYAVKKVSRFSDNPHAATYFSYLSNNFLWYERAMEDLLRRAIGAAKADPAVLGRAHVMFETAQHAGLVYRQQGTDDDGNPMTEYMFTWPGSGLAMRAVNEAAMALGLTNSSIVKTPVFQDLASPVQYLSPALSNPIGFSTNPMLGIPLRVVRDVFPSTQAPINDWLTALEGGVRGFASQGQGSGPGAILGDIVAELTPVYAQKAWNALNPDERDSEMASALKNALIYMDAAGKLPGPTASADERQQALDELRQQVQNVVMFRAVIGSLLPGDPGLMSSNVDDIGQADEFDKLRGINSIRAEWFKLLEDMTQRYGENRAMSEASTAWLQRDLGSIVHPEDFTVGTSGAPGDVTGKSFASSQELVQWMLDNQGFLKQYGQAAYKLMPAVAGPYYDQIGYQTQLRTGLRQHKTGPEMYNALVQAQGDRSYYSALDARDQAQAANPDQASGLYQQFDQYVANLKTANPVWAAAQDQQPDFVYTRMGPMVHQLATAPAGSLPAEIQPLQPQIQQVSSLYDEFRAKLAEYPSQSSTDVAQRSHWMSVYRNVGDALFKGGQLNDLWSAMKVYNS